MILEKKNSVTLEDIVFQGSSGILCVETGGPKPGSGCAGRGVITAFEKLDALNAFKIYSPDIVIYDVLGDVVCGGFAQPIRKGYAEDVYVVTSGEKMAMYAADNICQSVRNNSDRGYAKVKGLVLNSRNVPNEKQLVDEAAVEMGTTVLITIPRDPVVQAAENVGKTVMEYDPKCEMADVYRELARIVLGE